MISILTPKLSMCYYCIRTHPAVGGKFSKGLDYQVSTTTAWKVPGIDHDALGIGMIVFQVSFPQMIERSISQFRTISKQFLLGVTPIISSSNNIVSVACWLSWHHCNSFVQNWLPREIRIETHLLDVKKITFRKQQHNSKLLKVRLALTSEIGDDSVINEVMKMVWHISRYRPQRRDNNIWIPILRLFITLNTEQISRRISENL